MVGQGALIGLPAPRRFARCKLSEQIFRQQWNGVEADASRILDRIEDCGRGTIVGQLADAFRTVAAIWKGISSKNT